MQRSKVIIELIKDEINVVQAMDILNILLQDINDKKIKSWLNNEINGYSKDEKVPDYRIVSANITGNYIVGNMYCGLQCTNQPIPIKPELVEEYTKIRVSCGLNEVYQMSLAEKENENHCLLMPLHTLLAQEISIINGEVLSANRTLSIYAYTNILNKLKSKVVKIFMELEKKYGNLDNYYIDFSNKRAEKEVVKIINNIIYTDNSVHIGNDNNIEKSSVGVGNEN